MAEYPIRATGAVRILAAMPGEQIPRFSIAPAYNGGPLRTERYPDGIIIDLAGLSLNSQTITASIEHDDARLVGHATRINNDGRTLSIDGIVSAAGQESDNFVTSCKRGFPWRASVEARPLDRPEFIPADQAVKVNGQTFSGPVLVARRAELYGVSFVPRGADEHTSVTIAASAQGKKPMTKTITPELEQAVDADIQASDVTPQAATLLRAQALSGEISYPVFQRHLHQCVKAKQDLEALRASRPLGPRIVSGTSHDGKSAVQAAFFRYLGAESLGERILGADAMSAGSALRCTSFIDIVKASLTASGRDIPTSRDDMIKAVFSTSDLPTMLGNTANKLLLDSYQAFPSVAQQVATRLSANDFKAATGLRLTGDSKFRLVPPGGEIQHGTLTEQTFSFKIDTFARMFGITRQDVINDDLGAFATIPQIIGRGAAMKLEEAFWQLVLANTGNFFHATNGNYIEGADTPLDIASLGAAVAKMRQQTDTEGTPIMVQPKFLVVPPELESTADALYTSTNIALAGVTDVEKPDGNPHKGKYQPLVVPHLSNATYTGNSALAWYLFGLPTDVAAFGLAFLQGVDSPVVESDDAPFNTLGIQFRGYLDFGVCQVDHRGAVKSKGEV